MNGPITNLFASLYEWFGINPLYGTDMGAALRGYSADCTGQYTGTEWYSIIGLTMLAITVLVYAFQYHIVDSARFMRRRHWWLMALLIAVLDLLIGFTIPFNILQSNNYCSTGDNALHFSSMDCFGFGLTNAIWGFVVFVLITSVPWVRRFSRNCRHTTFWKP